MPLSRDLPVPAPSATHERALAAVRARPDLSRTPEGKLALENAWMVGPSAVLALCRNHPTPEQLDFEEHERRRRLRLQEVRRVAALALEAKLCLDGNLERMDDSTRRDVAMLIREEFKHPIALLAWWSALDAQHDIASKEDWRRVRAAAETTAVKDLLIKTNSAIKSAIAESHVPKRNRRRAAGPSYPARSRA